MDMSSLDDQSMLELLVERMTGKTKERFQDDHGDFLDKCDWFGIKCDSEGAIHTMRQNGHFKTFEGMVDLGFLPPSIKNLEIAYAKKCSGSLDTRILPSCLEELSFTYNAHYGTVLLSKLPETMKLLDIAGNDFEGTCDLTGLPQTLKYLSLSDNQFYGEITLTKLPDQLKEIHIAKNKFEGNISFASLPSNLRDLGISQYLFECYFHLINPPANLQYFQASSNKFEGTAVIHDSCEKFVFLRNNGIEAIVNQEGKPYESTTGMLQTGFSAYDF